MTGNPQRVWRSGQAERFLPRKPTRCAMPLPSVGAKSRGTDQNGSHQYIAPPATKRSCHDSHPPGIHPVRHGHRPASAVDRHRADLELDIFANDLFQSWPHLPDDHIHDRRRMLAHRVHVVGGDREKLRRAHMPSVTPYHRFYVVANTSFRRGRRGTERCLGVFVWGGAHRGCVLKTHERRRATALTTPIDSVFREVGSVDEVCLPAGRTIKTGGNRSRGHLLRF